MRFTIIIGLFSSTALAMASCFGKRATHEPALITRAHSSIIAVPKVFIITMFPPESDAWLENTSQPGGIGSLKGLNVTVQGFSPIYPHIRCLSDGSVCLLTTGEGEINAAATMSALVASPLFDLRRTYFLISGIAGVNPNHGTLADVAFSKYAVQVGLQYEFDAREVPTAAHWSTGYVPLGANHPDMYPRASYGTEVFELNEELRNTAYDFARTASLNDSDISVKYRSNYNLATAGNPATKWTAATRKPQVTKCDVVTSDQYFSGTLISESVENTTRLFTNGSATYCMTAQEDNATLESLIRGASSKLLDFSRIIIMRSAADFDRPYPRITCLDNLFNVVQGAFAPSIANLYNAGNPVVKGILNGWDSRFEKGIAPKNYVGDIFGTLGGRPDFGLGDVISDNPVQEKRSVGGEEMSSMDNPYGKGKWGRWMAKMAAEGRPY